MTPNLKEAVEQELKRLFRDGQNWENHSQTSDEPDDWWPDKQINSATQQILSTIHRELVGALPEKKPSFQGEYQNEYEGRCNGFNQALREVEKTLTKVLGMGE